MQRDPTLTRWSQVTHYYFGDCAYYTPAFSDEALGDLDLRTIVDVATNRMQANLYLGEPIMPANGSRSLLEKVRDWIGHAGLPADFDTALYYKLNPDVAAAGMDAATHYRKHGRDEGRRYLRR